MMGLTLRRFEEFFDRHGATLGFGAIGAAEQQEAVFNFDPRILGEDGGDDIEMRQIAMGENALRSFWYVLAGQRVYRPCPDPVGA